MNFHIFPDHHQEFLADASSLPSWLWPGEDVHDGAADLDLPRWKRALEVMRPGAAHLYWRQDGVPWRLADSTAEDGSFCSLC